MIFKNVHIMLHMHIAQCTRDCQNGGKCMLPDICTCAPGWNGMNCEIGESINFASKKVMFGILDFDEYNGYHLCVHNCTYMDGSYTYLCDPGYELQSDGGTLEGFTESYHSKKSYEIRNIR